MTGRQVPRIFASASRLRSLRHPASTMAVPRERSAPQQMEETRSDRSTVQMHQLNKVVVDMPSGNPNEPTDSTVNSVAESWGTCPAGLGTTTDAAPVPVEHIKTPSANGVHTHVQSFDEIPGPKGWPFIGTLGTYLVGNGLSRIYEHQIAFTKQYGPIWKERLGSLEFVNLADPELVSMMYRHDNKYPMRVDMKPWKAYRMHRNESLGVLTHEGKQWHRARRLLSKKILPPKTVGAYVGVINEVMEDMIQRLRYVRDVTNQDGLVPELTNEMYKWSMESIFKILFETRIGCLDKQIPAESQRFIDSIHQMFISGQILFVTSPEFFRKYNLKPWRDHEAAWDYIFSFARKAVDNRLAEISAQSESEGELEADGFLTYLLSSKQLSMKEIYSNACELLLAGVDTTSNTLAWVLYELSRHPEVEERLHQEVCQVLGSDKTRKANTEDLAQMPYLKSIIKEILRLYPVVPANNRILEKDIVIGGYHIPKKTIIGSLQYVIGRDPKVFEEPNSFRPERWLRDNSGRMHCSNSSFASVPFGFGPRMCIGRRIAELELNLALAKISQTFKLEYLGEGTVAPTVQGLLVPGGPVKVGFTDR
ncbi:cytochrome P450 27C1-like [Patiria miniata]|uniref:Cholesterol side-chain cleavage enzyme, mitochondrial n=1 Tax=Patiria miniata TaxID=46514 RepID=A0A914BRC6_PATMI|nr:cytochrome P450 27C1-like [Patiria miniata]